MRPTTIFPGPSGSMLFHYTTAETAFEHILATGKLRLSRYTAMRDPMEAKDWHLQFHWRANPASVVPDNVADGLTKALAKIRHHCRLLSMTEDAPEPDVADELPFSRGYARPRMWEHYGDLHRGVCLCFERGAFVAQLPKATGDVIDLHGPVRYSPTGLATSPARHVELPPFECGTSTDDLTTVLSDTLAEHVLEHFSDLFFLKTTDWASEREFRVFAGSSGAEEMYAPCADSLAAVVLGDRFPHWQIPAARAAAVAAGVDLLRLQWPGGVPTPEPVED